MDLDQPWAARQSPVMSTSCCQSLLSLTQLLEAQATQISKGQPICAMFNLNKCWSGKKAGQRCEKGFHVCCFKKPDGSA
eukprot:40771-Amphidinium_carterae.1